MKKLLLVLLVVVVMLATVSGVWAGQEKVAVCHLDEEGNYIPINIADPALDAHLAHGDGVVGEDLDENCDPLWAYAGCLPYAWNYTGGYLTYVETDGSDIQPWEGPFYKDTACTIDVFLLPIGYDFLIWADDLLYDFAIAFFHLEWAWSG